MEFLRKLFFQTSSQLKGLTTSQRLAIGSSAALVLVGLMWLVNWAQSPSLVPLLDQPLTAQQITPIQQRLEAEGIKYKTTGDTILVPAESRVRLLARLSQGNTLPKDISLGFMQLMEKSSPWLSMEDQNRRWSLALSNELAGVIKEFDGVVSASVFIDKNFRRTIGQGSIKPTASVSLTLQPGIQLDKSRVRAVASFVSSAVAGLDISDVSVVDRTNFQAYSVPKPQEGLATDELEIRRQQEKHFEDKIRALLASIPNLRVAVYAELDPEWKVTTDKSHGKPQPTREESENMTETRSTPAGGPGVNPNVGVNVAPAGGPSETSEKSSTVTEYASGVDEKVTRSEVLRNALKSLYASVNVPRSYLAAIYQKAHDGKEPTDAELEKDKGILDEKEKISRQVSTALALVDKKKNVEVGWFHDASSIALAGPAHAEAGTGETMLTLLRSHAGTAGLGMLALMSLLMMLMMVRRIGEGPVLPGEEPPKPLPLRIGPDGHPQRGDAVSPLTAGEGPIGEAELGEQLLEGREMDEQTLHITQIVQQVNDLIRDDPEASVQILQRWIDSESH